MGMRVGHRRPLRVSRTQTAATWRRRARTHQVSERGTLGARPLAAGQKQASEQAGKRRAAGSTWRPGPVSKRGGREEDPTATFRINLTIEEREKGIAGSQRLPHPHLGSNRIGATETHTMSGERNRRSLAFRTGAAGAAATAANAVKMQADLDTHNNTEAVNGALARSSPNKPAALLAEDGEDGAKVEAAQDQEEDWVETVVVDDVYPEQEASVRVVDGGSISSNESEEEAAAVDEEEETNGPRSDERAATPGDGAVVKVGREGEQEDEGEEASGCSRRGTGLTLLGRPQSFLLPQQRTFQRSWLQEFPWLQYEQETGLMYCSWCLRANSGQGSNNNRNKFVKGSRNYRRTTLLRHHLYAEHRENDPAAVAVAACMEESAITSRSTDELYSEYKSDRNEISYCYQLLQELNEQRQQGILCDVNIVVKGQVFKAHKNILVAGSRYFKTLYCYTPNESCDQVTVTHLDVVAVQGFTVILDFMYSGHLVLTSQNVIEVMSVASYLQMTDIVQACRGFIKEALNISTKSNATDKIIVQYEKVKTSNPSHRDNTLAMLKHEPSSPWVVKSTNTMNNCATGGPHEDRVKYDMEGYSLDVDSVMHQDESYQLNDANWSQENFTDYSGKDLQMGLPQDQSPAFSWGSLGKLMLQQAVPRSGRRKNHITRRIVYNVAPKVEEGTGENLMMQPPMAFSEDGLQEIHVDPFSGDASIGSQNKFKCPHCNYIAKYRRTLKRHQLIHTGVRSFACDICGKLFTRREHVKRHSLVHKKDKKYKCMVCKKFFTLAASVGIRHGSRRYGVCLDCSGGDRQSRSDHDGTDLMVDPEFFKEQQEEQDEPGGLEQEESERMVGEDVPDEEGAGDVDREQWEDAGASETYVILDND
ncbi:zinc finger and BTB domain-containing protein 10 isoform X2 [Narcine bancroftii]|uniref:zinc finger and BTB domain-containing protein 10 isoform X2 n=1 Tax=Narcine bancroftii TaxID=1343680 RepID=UPI0038311BC1